MSLSHHCRECGELVPPEGFCAAHPSAIVDTVIAPTHVTITLDPTTLGTTDAETIDAYCLSLAAVLESEFPGVRVAVTREACAAASCLDHAGIHARLRQIVESDEWISLLPSDAETITIDGLSNAAKTKCVVRYYAAAARARVTTNGDAVWFDASSFKDAVSKARALCAPLGGAS